MTDEYDSKSCNALEKPYYYPIEAALRWCGLVAHEAEILGRLGASGRPSTGDFPLWPCLQANTERILDAIANGDIPHGRDGKTVSGNDHVAPTRLTVRHTDLKAWMVKHMPASKPAFLFDEVERAIHPAITLEAYQALKAERDTLKSRLDNGLEKYRELEASHRALLEKASSGDTPGPRAETTYLNIIGGLLQLLLGHTPSGKPNSVYSNQASIVDALVAHSEGKPGISSRTLEEKFAAAKRSITAT